VSSGRTGSTVSLLPMPISNSYWWFSGSGETNRTVQ
jgi:hypothetical protein